MRIFSITKRLYMVLSDSKVWTALMEREFILLPFSSCTSIRLILSLWKRFYPVSFDLKHGLSVQDIYLFSTTLRINVSFNVWSLNRHHWTFKLKWDFLPARLFPEKFHSSLTCQCLCTALKPNPSAWQLLIRMQWLLEPQSLAEK